MHIKQGWETATCDITACFGSVRWTEIFSPRLLNLLILSLKNKSGAELFLVFFNESCCLLEAESWLRPELKQIFSLWISFRQQCSSLLWLMCRNHLLWRCRCGFGMKGHRVCTNTTKVARGNWGDLKTLQQLQSDRFMYLTSSNPNSRPSTAAPWIHNSCVCSSHIDAYASRAEARPDCRCWTFLGRQVKDATAAATGQLQR